MSDCPSVRSGITSEHHFVSNCAMQKKVFFTISISFFVCLIVLAGYIIADRITAQRDVPEWASQIPTEEEFLAAQANLPIIDPIPEYIGPIVIEDRYDISAEDHDATEKYNAIAEDTTTSVYYTPTGKRYHRYSCSTIQDSTLTEASRSEAETLGLTPCKVCDP